MDENKKRIKYCPNFYKIMNFVFFDDDDFSKKIIDVYQKYVFEVDITNKSNVDKLKQFDNIIGKYIDDRTFRKELKNNMKKIQVRKGLNAMEAIVEWIINSFDKYEYGFTRNIYFSRWF